MAILSIILSLHSLETSAVWGLPDDSTKTGSVRVTKGNYTAESKARCLVLTFPEWPAASDTAGHAFLLETLPSPYLHSTVPSWLPSYLPNFPSRLLFLIPLHCPNH